MCNTCVDLLGYTLCPPWRDTPGNGFEADLSFERDIDRALHAVPSDREPVDAVTSLVLRARLTAGAGRAVG